MAKYRPLEVSERDLLRIPEATLGSMLQAFIAARNAQDWSGYNNTGQLSTIRKIFDDLLQYIEEASEKLQEDSKDEVRRRVRVHLAARRRKEA